MFTKKSLSIIAALFMISTQAMAEIKLLATIHRTNDLATSELHLETDKNQDIVRVIFKALEEDGSLAWEIPVSPSELKEGKPVLTKMGMKIITLQSDNMAIQNGGHVKIKFLKQFKLFGSKYGDFEVMLDRLGDEWELSKDGVTFKSLLAYSHDKGINKFEVINGKK